MIVYFIQAHRDERQVLNLASLLLADPASFVIVSYDSHLPELQCGIPERRRLFLCFLAALPR